MDTVLIGSDCSRLHNTPGPGLLCKEISRTAATGDARFLEVRKGLKSGPERPDGEEPGGQDSPCIRGKKGI
jgi:hypothetical protein